jgi:hypothetical protein
LCFATDIFAGALINSGPLCQGKKILTAGCSRFPSLSTQIESANDKEKGAELSTRLELQ